MSAACLETHHASSMNVCILRCSIQALLSAPNPDDPLAENVAKHWKENEQEAVATGNVNPLFMYTVRSSSSMT